MCRVVSWNLPPKGGRFFSFRRLISESKFFCPRRNLGCLNSHHCASCSGRPPRPSPALEGLLTRLNPGVNARKIAPTEVQSVNFVLVACVSSRPQIYEIKRPLECGEHRGRLPSSKRPRLTSLSMYPSRKVSSSPRPVSRRIRSS